MELALEHCCSQMSCGFLGCFEVISPTRFLAVPRAFISNFRSLMEKAIIFHQTWVSVLQVLVRTFIDVTRVGNRSIGL
jgi:hypothetical protein